MLSSVSRRECTKSIILPLECFSEDDVLSLEAQKISVF